MLKGLSLDNVVDDAAEESVEVMGDNQADSGGRRSLRQPKTDAIYDMKYHPMDNITRPNMAATLRNRSKSVSFAMDGKDDESSEPSSPPRDGESDDEEDSDSDSSDEIVVMQMATPRTPDPRAVRHSSRGEARKPVNYSSKLHPKTTVSPATSTGRRERTRKSQ